MKKRYHLCMCVCDDCMDACSDGKMLILKTADGRMRVHQSCPDVSWDCVADVPDGTFGPFDEPHVEFYDSKTGKRSLPSGEGEVCVTDPVTGGQKGSKPVQLTRLLEMAPLAFLTDLGAVYEMGARKYSKDNWRKGYAWSLSFNAMLRHIAAMIRGEWVDPESGKPHACHVAWHAATLHEFEREGLGTDDRVRP